MMQHLTAEGDVEEREELLDGRVQVALGGATGDLDVSCTLVWLLGRDGDVPLEEGYLTLVSEDGELEAALESGTVAEQPETGAAVVRAAFVVDATSGGLSTEGARLHAEIDVGAERWSGELTLEG